MSVHYAHTEHSRFPPTHTILATDRCVKPRDPPGEHVLQPSNRFCFGRIRSAHRTLEGRERTGRHPAEWTIFARK